MFAIDFAHPARLWFLAALIPAGAWAARGATLRLRDWVALGQSGHPPGDGSAARWGAMALLVLALGQPRWGRLAGPEAAEGHDVVLCVDVSRSMGAEDVAPDRLGVAIGAGSALLGAIAEEPGHRAAVVAFAGRAAIRCPLTSRLDLAAEALRALRPGEVEPGGTDLGAALDAATGAFDLDGPAQGRTIVVLSDGEDHLGTWPRALDRLRAAGVLVHAVAIGDPDRGHPVPRIRPGPPAETRRTDVALGAIARGTGGALVPLGLASADLGALYRDRIAPTARRRRDEVRPPERTERFAVPLLAAVGLVLAGSWPGPARRRAFATAFLATLAIGAGPGADSPEALVGAGLAAFEAGRFAEALGDFDRAIALRPAAAVPRYDAAAALFRLGRHPEAIARYEEARDRGDPGLATKVDYALGNARLALGDPARALVHYDACLASTWPGPAFDAIRRDAAENRAFAASQIPPEAGGPGPDDSKSPRPDRPRPPSKSPGEGPSTGPSTPKAGQAGGPPTTPPPGSDSGGAGPDGSPPEARLDAALREIREGRSRRPADAPPPAPGGTAKDW